MSAASSIQLTPAERPLYAHLFALADPQSSGMVSGSAAVSFFALSGLPTPVLGSIWSIADSDNNGFLGPAQFSAALRLIGHAQSGKVVTEDTVRDPGPNPTFKGISIPPHLTGNTLASPQRSSSIMVQPMSTGSGGFGTSEIKPEDRARYTRIFASSGPQGGLLDGDKAKEIFIKSKLPFDKLGAIWNLADTKARGKLDLTDFVIGMHFIQSTMNGTLTTIPASLPAGLYERAAGSVAPPGSPTGTAPLGAQNTGGSTGYLSRQMTGSNQFGAAATTPLRSNIRSPPPQSQSSSILQAQRTGSTFSPLGASNNWAVSAADKAKSDRFFDGLDQDRKGVLEGQAAVPFFMQSGLNEVTLAHVWDLSDITQSGSLSKDEFAVAMHLINMKITGSDLPQELPSSLVPPSLRGANLPQAVNPAETDTQRDLFSLMDDDVDLPVSTQSAFAVPAPSNNAQARTAPKTTSGPFDDDFVGSNPATNVATPTMLSPTVTGTNTGAAQRAFTPQMTGDQGSRGVSQMPYGDASTEAANQRLALDSTQKSLSTLEQRKGELEKGVASDANSLQDLTTRLETVRMRHQTESEAVKALTERQASQALELKRLREESVREESELSRLRAEKDEIEQTLMKDREDVREMKKLVGERTKLKEQLKVELEKLKKDARMQKGLVAIGKKQLTQADGEVASVQTAMEDAKAGKGIDEGEAQHAEHGEVAMSPRSDAVPLARNTTGTSAVLSPAASVKSNNPFDRLPSHAGGAAAIGAALGVASAAGAGAAMAHHESSTGDSDPFGVKSQEIAATQSAPTVPSAAFDDGFGNFDSPAAVSGAPPQAPSSSSNVNHAFDDAFADFDEPQAADTEASKAVNDTEAITTAIPGSFTAPQAPVVDEPVSQTEHPSMASETREASADDFTHVQAPTASEVTSDAIVGASMDKGKGVARSEEGENEEDSSDEEEEPEDVEATTARRMVDSPDEVGEGKAPVSTQDTATAAAALPPADSAAQAANRFPELPPDEGETTAKAPISAGATAIPASHGADSDGFQDAFSELQDTQGSAQESAPSSGFVAITSHDRYSTALENTDSSLRSVSPSKTRRAPPPAPSRGATGMVAAAAGAGAAGAAPAVANYGPFASSLPPSGSDMTNRPKDGLDDFDAAFEDLGPTSNGATGNTSTSSSMPGFEDAFGDADDFDFVPSFHDAPTGGVTAQPQAQSGGFDGFDSAFDSAFDTEPSAAKAAPAGANVNTNTSSGFSFDDAFAPAEGNTASASAAAPAAAAPPSLPARAPTSSTPATADASAGALPDDAAPVRQLCAMGFSRSDVIKSLEKSNYRTDKALERLLAQA